MIALPSPTAPPPRLPVKPAQSAEPAQPVSRPRHRIEFLDEWRGVAVLAVFLYHCFGFSFGRFHPSWVGWFSNLQVPKSFLILLPCTWGGAGVAIFFVISGFCIHLSFNQRPNHRSFFQARFFRIYPPYVIAMLFFGLLFPITRLPLHSTLGTWQLVSHIFLLHNFYGAWTYAISPSFWSIAVEAQLYLLYPLVLLIAGRFGWRRSLILLAAVELSLRGAQSVFSVTLGEAPPEWLVSSPFSYWFSWAIGAAVAEAYLKGTPIPFRRFSPIALATASAGCLFVKPLMSISFLLAALATAAAMARKLNTDCSLPGSGIFGFFREHLRRAGIWSYSIYLLHQPLLLGLTWLVYRTHFVGSPHPLKIFGLALVAWIPITKLSCWFFEFCEKPSVQLGKALGRIADSASRFLPTAAPEVSAKKPVPSYGLTITR